MVDTYSIKDVTRDLGQMITMTKMFEMDDEGYWVDWARNERFVHRLDANDTGKQIVMFQDPMPKGDLYFFNPFAEGYGNKTPVVSFFYKAIRAAANVNIRTALLFMARAVLESKDALEANKEHSLSHVVVRMSSIPIDKKSTVYDVIDEKMVDEFERLADRINNEFVNVAFMAQQMTAKVTCDVLTDDKWDEKYGKDIRKKSLGAFKAALQGVLGIQTPEGLHDFSVKHDPEIRTAVKLHTTMLAYLKLYARFNDVLAMAYAVDGKPSERDEINLGELSMIIDRFPLAYAIAKHMVQPVLPKVHPTDTATADTTKLRIGGDAPGGAGFGTRRFAGPEVIDDLGRRSRQSNGGQGLQFGRPVSDAPKRFAPHVISDVPVDPFAPSIRPINSSPISTGFQGGFNTPSQGGYFNNGRVGSTFGGGGGVGLDLNPPSNFGTAGTRRTYF